MNVRTDLKGLNRAVLLGLSLLLTGLHSAAAQTHSVSTPEMAARISTKVNLSLGLTTLEKVTQSLSAQTGLSIEASTYLRDRKLIIQMKDMSAAAALNSLAELNDWQWMEVKENHLLITRPTINRPQNVPEISRAIQAALPKDFRRYMGIGVPVDDLPLIDNPKTSRSFEREREVHPMRRTEMLVRVNSKIRPLLEAQQNELFQTTQPGILGGKELAYSRLLPSQKKSLVVSLVVRALSDLCGGNPTIIPVTPLNVMTGYIRSDLLDVEKDEIFLFHGTDLMIGRTVIENGVLTYSGSEAPIEHRTPKPKPHASP